MKSVDEFVKENCEGPKTLAGELACYQELNTKIEDVLSKKKVYDALINDKQNSNKTNKLSFKEQWDLYRIIDNLIKKSSGEYTYLGIDLLNLKNRLENVFSIALNYAKINEELRSLRESKRRIPQNITFDIFYNNYFNERCMDRHFFVRLDDELKCMCCGATTKDYPLSKEELDFLTFCAESQGILLKEVTKYDLPLLQVLMAKQNYYRNLRNSLNSVDDEDYLEQAENQWLSEQAEISDLRRAVRKAHLLDSKIYDSEDIKVTNPKYLSEEQAKELLNEVENEYEKLQKSNSRFKDLMLEECKTARYEILILSGAHIPTLLNQAQDEEDKVALTKAYYNISSQEFRINSNYFSSIDQAIFYDCLTANKEINNRILQMKLTVK